MVSPIVSSTWLAEHLDDPQVRIIDIRGRVLPPDQALPHYYAHHEAYLASHIPNALFVDWRVDIVDPDSASMDIAKPERFAEQMQKLGIGDDTLVVAYDDAGGMFAARLWWSLNFYGHSQVAVLDGGWQQWLKEGRPTIAEIPQVMPKTFTPHPQTGWGVNAEDVMQRPQDTALVDVRTEDEFMGRSSRARRAGHIPSAIHLARSQLLGTDGCFLAPDALKLKFEGAGVRVGEQTAIFYCNGGVSASYALLAFQLAGGQGQVYDGSWKDWGNDDSKPIV